MFARSKFITSVCTVDCNLELCSALVAAGTNLFIINDRISAIPGPVVNGMSRSFVDDATVKSSVWVSDFQGDH